MVSPIYLTYLLKIEGTNIHESGCCLKGGINMLWTIFVILMIMWLLGLVSGYTINGFIHILLVIALVVVLIRIIQGRRPL